MPLNTILTQTQLKEITQNQSKFYRRCTNNTHKKNQLNFRESDH